MKQEINPKHFQAVMTELMAGNNVRSAVKYLSETLVVKATWQHKPKANSRGETAIVTFGKPNYRERAYIARWKKQDGGKFHDGVTHLIYYPKKK